MTGSAEFGEHEIRFFISSGVCTEKVLKEKFKIEKCIKNLLKLKQRSFKKLNCFETKLLIGPMKIFCT